MPSSYYILLTPTGAFPRTSAAMRSLFVLVSCALLLSCRDPRAEANIAEAMIQVGTEMSALRQDLAGLQNEVDSLRAVVARQDTIVSRLAAAANMPVPPR